MKGGMIGRNRPAATQCGFLSSSQPWKNFGVKALLWVAATVR